MSNPYISGDVLLKEISRLREALEFYADPNNYEEGPIPEKRGTFHEYAIPIISDEGARAREALK